MSEYSKKYYRKNKDKWKIYNNTPKAKLYQKKYNKKHEKQSKEWRANNPEKTRKYKNNYRNSDKGKATEKAYMQKNKEKIKRQSKEWRINSPDKVRNYKKKYRNSDKGKTTEKTYIKTHKDEIRQYNTAWKREFRKSEKGIKYYAEYRSRPIVKLRKNISRNIRAHLGRKKTYTSVKYLGCTISFFKNWVEKQFDQNMTWENYGIYWHIDHIIPASKFTLNGTMSCWNYNNLRPLNAKENERKHDHLPDIKSIYRYFVSVFPKTPKL